ncbi:lysyl-tRNA synthetase, class II [Geodermatophilus saharensis]|uniref:Lysine--tRNA ligase n=1 Tax=Geodermatophilus saharensis TaxID=1137994 RepID=A0A239D0I8_9ACTN|nr:lysine--tRNA ligase [Geodermatophilus saharensis]SNS25870.1 lysyl-tRNA synthetase, class II [Geodermatophilus saharensis]
MTGDEPLPGAPTDAGDGAAGSAGRSSGQRAHRLAKLRALQARGALPYRWPTDATAAGIRERHAGLPPGRRTEDRVRVAGRLERVRRQGFLTFATLRDRTGAVQLFVDTSVLGAGRHAEFDDADRGDWLGVEGTVVTTRRGELSVCVEDFAVLGKALLPPPDPHTGLTDVETRYRQRYTDLEVNERTREVFRIRHAAVRAIRRSLEDRGFTEVEGPVLQTIQGGASARPFVTHHNALDVDLYLRIALELHLKRLVVGGMERVFEIGRVFRNEGIDTRHNPEFTMLEAYQAFADYTDMMDLVEDLVVEAARAALGGDLTVHAAGHAIDLGATPWPRRRFADMIADATGETMHPAMPVAEARAVLDRLGIPYEAAWGAGRLMKEVYDERVQHSVVGPVFCVDYPREVSPLARTHRSDPAYVERFELIVAGFELSNAYSEQNDAVEQLAAFEAEARAKAHGDPEAGDVDLDYVRALERGMPCTGGIGIGIDRLVVLLASVDSIREVVLFPTLRPESGPPPGGGPRGAPRPLLAPTPLPAAASPGDGAARSGSVVALPTTAPSAHPVPPPPPRAGVHPVAVRVLAALTALAGVLHLAVRVPVVHDRWGRAPELDPLELPVAGSVTSVVVGLLLVLLAGQLARRKRRAWQLVVALFAVGAVAHVLKGPHPVAVAVCAAMLAALVTYRRAFAAPGDPPSLLRVLHVLPLYLGAVLLTGLTTLWVDRADVEPRLTLGGALQTVLAGLVGLDGPHTYRSAFLASFLPAALLALGIAGVVVLAVLLLRPLAARRPHTEDDWAHAERLVHTHGWDTLAYFTLRDDKSFFFSRDGEAFLAYTYLGGYALVSGDPVGARESVVRVLDEFLAFCDERAWTPALLAVREASMPLYASRGFTSVYLGDEAVVDCRRFTLEGPGRKGLRAAVRRVGRTHRFRLLAETDAPPALVDRLNAISARWRGKNPERGFTMTLSQDVRGAGADPQFLLCVALDADGVPGGFLRLVPAYGPDFGYTLDLMRHDPDAPNGMTEFLVAATATALAERGVARLSMNFAMWGRLLDDDVPFTPVQRAARWAVGVLNPFFQIRSLREFNARFGPEWLPRVLAVRRRADLPRVGLRYAGAEGFLAVPGVGPLLVPRAVGGVPAPSDPAGPAAA